MTRMGFHRVKLLECDLAVIVIMFPVAILASCERHPTQLLLTNITTNLVMVLAVLDQPPSYYSL